MDIRRIQDINLSDIELRTRYYGLMSAGMIDEAKLMIVSYPQLKGKVLNSEMLNQFVDSVLELEQNYYTEVEDFLLEQRNDFQLSIDELVYIGEYDNLTQYEVNNFVVYGDNIYFCYVIPPIGTLPTNEDYWIELNLKGERGLLSLGVQFVGLWDVTRTYREKEMVIYQNKMYVSKKSGVGNIPLDHEYWIVAIDNKPQSIYVGVEEPKHMQVNSLWIKIIQ